MPTCKRCEEAKVSADFYANDRTCKECRKAMVRSNRNRRAEQYRAYDRARANRPDRVAARARYASTEAGKEAGNRAKRAYMVRNPRRRKAHAAFRNALRDGHVKAPPCCMAPDCLNTKDLEGHHTHYGDPLVVVWLCRRCHVQVHRENRQMAREGRS